MGFTPFLLQQPNAFSEAWGERSDDAVERWVRSDVWCHLAISHSVKVLVETLNNFEGGSDISNKSPELFIITAFEELEGLNCLGKLCLLKWLCSGIIGPMGNVACLHHYNTKSGACAEYLSLHNSSPKSLLRKVTFPKNIAFLSHQTEAVKIKRK